MRAKEGEKVAADYPYCYQDYQYEYEYENENNPECGTRVHVHVFCRQRKIIAPISTSINPNRAPPIVVPSPYSVLKSSDDGD